MGVAGSCSHAPLRRSRASAAPIADLEDPNRPVPAVPICGCHCSAPKLRMPRPVVISVTSASTRVRRSMTRRLVEPEATTAALGLVQISPDTVGEVLVDADRFRLLHPAHPGVTITTRIGWSSGALSGSGSCRTPPIAQHTSPGRRYIVSRARLGMPYCCSCKGRGDGGYRTRDGPRGGRFGNV
jgi:hypothetical protein